ncbi:hypothetical protein WCP94_004503 [Bilophila wadsworthia]
MPDHTAAFLFFSGSTSFSGAARDHALHADYPVCMSAGSGLYDVLAIFLSCHL